jgi:hypothetical protein
MALAPIALFAYKRPAHLKRTLEALQACPLAEASELYVFSDAPKNAEDRRAVEQVRELLRSIEGFARVKVTCREENFGLGQSIIKGVTELCEAHGQVIVLEDDLVVARGFLVFMNQALDRYKDAPKVMQVSGYMFPIARAEELGNTFLCRVPASWGWGTWNRAWKCFNPDSEKLLTLLARASRQREFDVNGSFPYFDMLQQQVNGKMDVWGVRWYASMFLKGGLCLYPSQSLVLNIGMDGSGMHCGPSTVFDGRLSTKDRWQFTERIEESRRGVELISEFLLGGRGRDKNSLIPSTLSRLKSAARKFRALMKRTSIRLES